MQICYKCGGKGTLGGCPVCNKEKEKETIEFTENTDVEKVIKRARFLMIPENYLGLEWSKDTIQSVKSIFKSNAYANAFFNSLEKIHNSYKNGMLYSKSVYLYSPPNSSKDIFVYSCMQFASKNGYSVAPYLDTVDAKRLVHLSAINPSYKLYNRYNYDHYINSDVMFLKVPSNEFLEYSYDTLKFIVEKRARIGLCTIMISNHSLEEISTYSMDKRQASKWSEVPELNIDEKKYPVVAGFML